MPEHLESAAWQEMPSTKKMIVKKVIVMDPFYRGGVGESMEPRLHAEEIDAPDGFIATVARQCAKAPRLHCWVRLLHRR